MQEAKSHQKVDKRAECTWRHGSHVGGHERKHFSPLGTKLYFHVNSSRLNYIVLTIDMAALSRGCKPRIDRFTHVINIYMLIYWHKTKGLHKKKNSTPTGSVWNTNMAADSLFCNTNMAEVTSCENSIFFYVLRVGINCGFWVTDHLYPPPPPPPTFSQHQHFLLT